MKRGGGEGGEGGKSNQEEKKRKKKKTFQISKKDNMLVQKKRDIFFKSTFSS